MSKYRLLRDRVVASPHHQDDVLLVPPAVSREQLALAHCTCYIDRVLTGTLSTPEIKRIGFPWSEKMVERSLRSSGATLAAARAALTDGFAVNMAGGTHHAMHDAGEGFCVFNDAAVTIRNLIHEGTIGRALVVDCDVHQGNGTAHILETTSTFLLALSTAKKTFHCGNTRVRSMSTSQTEQRTLRTWPRSNQLSTNAILPAPTIS